MGRTNKKQILRPFFGGLGDSLQFSTLPRMLSEQGYEVYISNKTEYRTGVYELVWGKNPYVKGLSDKKPTIGDLEGVVYENKCDNFIMNWEYVLGLEPTNKYPEIYYEPTNRDFLNDKIFVDITAKALIDEYNIGKVHEYVRSFDDIIFMGGDDIFLFADWIYSCKKFICLCSGGNSLASALQKYKDIDVECLVPKESGLVQTMYARKHFFYDNIKYIWL